MQLGAPDGQRLRRQRARLLGVSLEPRCELRHHFVHGVVHRAAEVPHRDDGAAACAAAAPGTSSRSWCRGSSPATQVTSRHASQPHVDGAEAGPASQDVEVLRARCDRARACRRARSREARGAAGRVSASHSGRPAWNSARVRSTAAASAEPPRPCDVSGRQVGLVSAVAAALLLRQVDAAAFEVDLQVLPEVRELQRRADGVRPRVQPGVVDSRRCAAPAGPPDWRNGGCSRARRPRSHSA